MSPICYYFVNNTRKEFCLFNNEISILLSLSNAIESNAGWKNTDKICVDSEDAGYTNLIEYLINEMGYTDLDYQGEDA